ncbi:hypothetical protein NWFMUON74_17990 [Nocardia wallacei]|uniref:Uncharacterized protein n=1 Tax=Nocardia wallacei TaxID=480035 RepID=A0A7G1KFP1_9NOCA|nr:hypothetical protein NWFMUON74_17990 [Nocardia wallacei]
MRTFHFGIPHLTVSYLAEPVIRLEQPISRYPACPVCAAETTCGISRIAGLRPSPAAATRSAVRAGYDPNPLAQQPDRRMWEVMGLAKIIVAAAARLLRMDDGRMGGRWTWL